MQRRYEDDVVDMMMSKDIQHRSLSVIASKAKQGEGEGGEDASPPWRGEFRKLTTLGNWGGLMSNKQNPEECDATDDEQCCFT